jgi:hypothetical protein
MLEKIQQHLFNDENQIKLLLFCIEHNIDSEYVILHENTEEDLKLLDKARILKYDYDLDKYVLTKDKLAEDIRDEIDIYRAVFSKGEKGLIGLVPGALGDRKEIVKKLNRWFKENKDYSMSDVINTARYYVNDITKSGNLKYLQSADFFIDKSGRSRLTSLIQEGKDYVPNDLNFSSELI